MFSVVKVARDQTQPGSLLTLASSRCSVSQGAAKKTAREKNKKARLLSPRFFFYFFARCSSLRPDERGYPHSLQGAVRWETLQFRDRRCNIEYKVCTYMLFTGREVRIGKNCAWGLEAVLETEGTVFFQYGPTKAGE